MNDGELAGSSPTGEQPRSSGPLRQLVEHLEENQRARWQRGEHVRVEDYLEQHPALQAFADGIVDLVYNEFLLRQSEGEAPPLEEYLQRFPLLARQLRDQFEVHAALTRSSSTVHAVHAAAPTELPAIPGYEIIK